VSSIGFGEPAVSFGNVGGDGERGTVGLVDEKPYPREKPSVR